MKSSRCLLVSLMLLLLLTAIAPAATNGAWMLNSVHMVSPTQGWAVGETSAGSVNFRGSVILRTFDGGRHWSNVSPHNNSLSSFVTAELAVHAAFFNADTAWIAVNEEDYPYPQICVVRTSNGGKSWQVSRLHNSASGNELYIQIVNPRDGFLLAISDAASGQMGKAIYRTTDGGATWMEMSETNFQSSATTEKKALPLAGFPTGLTFQNARNGWVTFNTYAMPDEYLYQTTDGGHSWRHCLLRLPQKYQGCAVNAYPPIFFGESKRNGLLPVKFYYDRVEGFTVYITYDSGVHWRSTNSRSVSDAEAQSCFFVDPTHGWIIDAQNRLLATSDSGRHWSGNKQPIAFLGADISLDFLTPHIGWAMVVDSNLDTGDRNSKLLKTQDGGQHWTQIYTHTLPMRLKQHGYVKKSFLLLDKHSVKLLQ